MKGSLAPRPVDGLAGDLIDTPVVFVDVETTGGHPALHRVIEIGLVAACGPELEWQWSSLVNPGGAIPHYIEQFTGITNEMVRDAPTFEELAGELSERLKGRLFVAHNARFDYGFFRGEFRRLGHNFTTRVACTVKLSRRLFPDMPRHNLDAVIEYHGLECAGDRHRALPDADALWQLWRRLHLSLPRAQFEDALAAIVLRPVVPAHLPPEIVEELPEAHGVYRFYGCSAGGAHDALLYVGKANNIRERVLQHWHAATHDAKAQRLFEQTRRVAWSETAGELGALLLEARTIRADKPLYNRRLRGSEAYTWLIGDDGATPRLVQLDWTTIGAGDLFGLYASERKAQQALEAIAREHRLCLQVLGLEAGAPSGSASCFGYQVGRCSGACVGREPRSLHLARAKLALAPLKLRPWPYRAAIGIREISVNGLEHVHLVQNWQHLGTLTPDTPPDAATALAAALPPAQSFDYDAYRILLRWLTANPNARLLEAPRAMRVAEARGAAAGDSLTVEYEPGGGSVADHAGAHRNSSAA